MISTQFVRTSLWIFLLAHVCAKHLRIYKTSCDLYLSVALGTLEFMLGEIVSSVEAAVFFRVVQTVTITRKPSSLVLEMTSLFTAANLTICFLKKMLQILKRWVKVS